MAEKTDQDRIPVLGEVCTIVLELLQMDKFLDN